MKIHELKTWPVFFQAVLNGTKTFEVRKNDRDFKIGDRLDLMEYDPDAESYTGAHCHRFISYILGLNPFIDLQGNVILGFKIEQTSAPVSGNQSMYDKIEEFVSIYMMEVGNVDKKDIIEHDLREGISMGLILYDELVPDEQEQSQSKPNEKDTILSDFADKLSLKSIHDDPEIAEASYNAVNELLKQSKPVKPEPGTILTAKEWMFKVYPESKEDWDMTGHDDGYMVKMMEQYAEYRNQPSVQDSESPQVPEAAMIEKAINEMIEANLPIKGFKEWMIEKQFDHNSSYTEFYAEAEEGYMMYGINKLYKHWIELNHKEIPIIKAYRDKQIKGK